MTITSEDSLPPGLPNGRIYVTGHTDTGLATILSSSIGDWQWFPHRNVGFNVVYTTSSFPVDMNDNADFVSHMEAVTSGSLGLVRPGGTVCRIVDFGPGGKPLMHRTQSLDYGVILEGEIEMELDDGSVTLLKRGDIAVQRGTRHAWRNPSQTTWARILFVLQDCKPVRVCGKQLMEDLGHAKDDIPQSRNDGV
ncbi:hypothetical protein BDV26DRAFT_301058 [Aspergillus bertholletiae]|uniref:Cupin type-2 domain-containing protein n=1 Tax=Aspergillus bertholletiae TaxID=1226010 RepID=A0A5N7BJ35_9EURO|nr:hypothetical protein BDV26DRAFT_301058 [Aspergillus bertholletiae]